MTDYIIELIKKSRNRKKRIYQENKKKYWKLTASERLHYDSVRKGIDKDNNIPILPLTFGLVKIFFWVFVFFLVMKILLELDTEIFIRIILILTPVFPLIFKVSITIDLLSFFIYQFINKPRQIKKLDKNYGFKTQD